MNAHISALKYYKISMAQMGQGCGLCGTVCTSATRCEDSKPRHLLQLIYYVASKRKHHDSCKSIHDKQPNTHSHTPPPVRTHSNTCPLKSSLSRGDSLARSLVCCANAYFRVALIHPPGYSPCHVQPCNCDPSRCSGQY